MPVFIPELHRGVPGYRSRLIAHDSLGYINSVFKATVSARNLGR